MKRLYEQVLADHFAHYRQMIILNGPRQVGKTTLSKNLRLKGLSSIYLNWDIKEDREQILAGQRTLTEQLGLTSLQKKVFVIFDELHKYKQWKSFLKGFYDAYSEQCHILVTGSQKLSLEQKSGESLMGRYFPFRIHPISVAEYLHKTLSENLIREPKRTSKTQFNLLWQFGGYPDPFLKKDNRFLTRWQKLREQQLFQEDIRDLSQIQGITQLEILAQLLKLQVGQLINYTNLAKKVNVTTRTVTKWLDTLEQFYYCFRIRPWTKNISRSLLKEPKMYLWDWSGIKDKGARAENFIACHLLKAVHFWTDFGFGQYDLFFIRTKDKQEVDFLVTQNNEPWFLIEVKYGNHHSIAKALYYFQKQLNAPHAFQVAFDADFVDIDCFSRHDPVIVPAMTLLSQLI